MKNGKVNHKIKSDKLSYKFRIISNSVVQVASGFFRATVLAGIILLTSFSALSQNLLVTTPNGSNSIYEYTTDGVQSIFASGLSEPLALALNNAGNIFVAELGGSYVTEFTPDNVRNTFSSGVQQWGLAINRSGYVFVTDHIHGTVIKIAPDGVQNTFASGFIFPTELAFDGSDNLYVAQPNRTNIIQITPSGVQSTFASGLVANGLAFNAAGDLFASDPNAETVIRIATNGTQSIFVSGVQGASGLAFDASGNLFVASDLPEGYITKIMPGGQKNIFTSGLVYPFGLAFRQVVPTLKIAVISSNTALINWVSPSNSFLPQFPTNYVLTQNQVLGASNWVLSTNTADRVNGTNSVIISLTASNMFFRLMNP